MDEFDDGRDVGVVHTLIPARPRGDDDKQGPKPLSTPTDNVFGDLVDQCDIAGQSVPDCRIQHVQVFADQLPDLIDLHLIDFIV